jgi:hypothetical protein
MFLEIRVEMLGHSTRIYLQRARRMVLPLLGERVGVRADQSSFCFFLASLSIEH